MLSTFRKNLKLDRMDFSSLRTNFIFDVAFYIQTPNFKMISMGTGGGMKATSRMSKIGSLGCEKVVKFEYFSSFAEYLDNKETNN